MKNLTVSKFLGVIATNDGKSFSIYVESNEGALLEITMPYKLELDLVLPLQIASNSAAKKRGSMTTGCHRSMRPSGMKIITNADGTTVMQMTFDGRNKLDILLPSVAINRLRNIGREICTMNSSKLLN